MTDYYAQIARHIHANAPAGFARATIECLWFSGVIKGPAVAYFDASGARVPSGWPSGVQRELSRMFHPGSTAERTRHATPAGDLPNVFGFEVRADGSFAERWTYDPQAQVKEDARLRASLGDKEFERLQSPAPPRAAMPPPAVPASAGTGDDAPLSIPELLGFIQEEIAKDAPDNWKTLLVEGEVWDEGGMSNIRTVYYYTLPNDATRRQFSARNMFGPMNAVKRLHRQMATEGKPWRKVKLEYTAGSTRTLVDTE